MDRMRKESPARWAAGAAAPAPAGSIEKCAEAPFFSVSRARARDAVAAYLAILTAPSPPRPLTAQVILPSCCRRSLLVAESPEHRTPLGLIVCALDTLGRTAVDHADHAASACVLRHDHAHRVRRRAKDRTYFAYGLDLIEHVDRECVAKNHHEHVSCPDCRSRFDRRMLQRGVGAGAPNQAWSRCLAERQPELDSRDRLRESLVNVLDGFDEVRRSDDHVGVRGFRDFDDTQLHSACPL